jgi:hypothetical protein
MADTANQVLSMNMMPNIKVVHKDARYLSSDDIKAAADLLVFEVSLRSSMSTRTETHSNLPSYPTRSTVLGPWAVQALESDLGRLPSTNCFIEQLHTQQVERKV